MSFLRDDLLETNVPEEGVRDAFGAELMELGKEDPDVVVLSADLAGSTKTAQFAKVDPARMINMGISEQDMIGTAAGLSIAGKKVYVSTFAIFLTGRCWEQIRQSICHAEVKVNLVSTHGGISVGPDGGSHQMVEDISLMRTLPLMNVIVPGDAEETRQAIRFIKDDPRLFYVRTSRIKYPLVYTPEYRFEFGKGVTMIESDDDIATIIACGAVLKPSLLAAKALRDQGLPVRVINMPTIKPIDHELIEKAARDTGLIITAEEHVINGGLGSAVSEAVCETYPVPVHRLGLFNIFGQSGDAPDLFRYYNLDAPGIADGVRFALNRYDARRPASVSVS